jgi:hypothetical protein
MRYSIYFAWFVAVLSICVLTTLASLQGFTSVERAAESTIVMAAQIPLDQDSTGAMQRPQAHLPRCQTEAATKRSGLIATRDRFRASPRTSIRRP